MRKHYLDNIRWITVLLVVFYHVIYFYSAVVQEFSVGSFRQVQIQDGFLYLVYPWFMILLFLVSGICSRYYLQRHSVKAFVGSRSRKLLVPSTIGLLAFQWILGWFSMTFSGAFETMPVDTMPKPVLFLIMAMSGIGPLWYIQTLWLFSMILALVRKCEKKEKLFHFCSKISVLVLILLGIPVWASAQILNTPVITVYRLGVYGFSFFLGYFVFAHEEVLERLSKFWHILTAVAAVLGILYTLRYFGEPFYGDPVVSSPFSMAYAWITILAIFAVMYRFGNWDNGLTRFMNRESFGLYVFHYLGISVAVYLIGIPPVLPAGLCYLLAGVGGFGGSVLLYELISRIPLIRWCVLGIKKEKKYVQ